jgi:cell division protein FtsB
VSPAGAPGAVRGRAMRRSPEGDRRPLGLTSRGLLLFLVLFALAVAAVYPLREYVAQHNRIVALQAKQRALQAENDRLAREQDRLRDPAYVEQLAKRDFHLVRPGEQAWQLSGTPPAAAAAAAAAPPPRAPQRPWYQRVWEHLTGWAN